MDALRIPLIDRDSSKFFTKVFEETFQHRAANNIRRKDFMDLLMQLVNIGHLEDDDSEASNISSDSLFLLISINFKLLIRIEFVVSLLLVENLKIIKIKNYWYKICDIQIIFSDSLQGKITMMEAAAQAFVFILGGFETSSTAISHCLYELAVHPEIQDKVREEIKSVLKEHGQISYDSLKRMKYLQQCINGRYLLI